MLKFSARPKLPSWGSLLIAAVILGSAACGGGGGEGSRGPQVAERVHISTANPRYLEWRESLIYPLGVTESGPETCDGQNGWTPISSGFDWQPDLEKMLAHGGNFARVLPYFPQHPIMPWAKTPDGRFDLSVFDETWVTRLNQYFAWTEERGVVILLEVFDNWSFQNMEVGWANNPWNPVKNVNYGPEEISKTTSRENVAIYKAVTDEKEVALGLLQTYVNKLLDESLPYGNIIYDISNESNAPLSWSVYWANYIREYASARGINVMVGEMPHAFEPSTGLAPILTNSSFDFADASSVTSEDKFGQDNERAEVEGTDQVLTQAAATVKKPITIGKIYYRSAATLWSKFINGAAAVRFHRNCARGGSDEDSPETYFRYVENLRTFVNELDLSFELSMEDNLAKVSPEGVHVDVLAAPAKWYAVYLYKTDRNLRQVEVSIDLPAGKQTARWFDPEAGVWTHAQAKGSASNSFETPSFNGSIALLVTYDAD